MSVLSQLSEEIQNQIFGFKPPCELKLILQTYSKYSYLFESESSLHELAKDYGLPYYQGVHLINYVNIKK